MCLRRLSQPGTEPLTIVISTQNNDPNHIMTELVSYGRKVLDGVIDDPTFHATILQAPEDADIWDERTWFACNPALDDFRDLEEMRIYAQQAKRIPARETTFRGLYLNQPTDTDARFISSVDWDACAGDINIDALTGQRCWAGLDLSSTTDLTACVLYFPENGGAILPYFWVPGDRLEERELTDRVPYNTWRRQGYLEANPGRAIDKTAIAARLAELNAKFRITAIAHDRWRIEDLQKTLDDQGIRLPLKGFGQGFRDMGPAVDALETAILDRRLCHPRNPVLTWNLSNAIVQMDPAGSRKISKSKSIERVDGVVALAMAIGLCAREPKPYEFTPPLVVAI